MMASRVVEFRPEAPAIHKPRYLFVIASSCQMYSGTGTAIYDWIRFSRDTFDFSITMDTQFELNFAHAAKFCADNDIEFIPSAPTHLPGCIDTGVGDVARILAGGAFDIVETVSWANAATNLLLLAALGGDHVLLYTPHAQPLWTIGDFAATACIKPVFQRTLARANAVFVDSPRETELELFDGHHLSNTHIVPLGIDTERFRCGADKRRDGRKGMILTVCDFREKRKRVDLLFAAFEQAVAVAPELRLVIAGRGSDSVALPASIEKSVEREGFISEERLLSLYRQADVFALMSDYEAFGLPIAEALCCGAQTLLNRQAVTESLFGGMPGVTFCDNRDVDAVSRLMVAMARDPLAKSAVAAEATRRFSFTATYGQKRAIVLDQLVRRQAA